MMNLIIALVFILAGVFIFLLGRWFGAMMHESKVRQDIKNTGLFMLNDGFYTAVKVNIDTSKPRKDLDPDELFQDFRQPEKHKRLNSNGAAK